MGRSYEIRSRLDHPVIDVDGHTVELSPLLMDYVRQIAGSEVTDRIRNADISSLRPRTWEKMTPEEQRDRWSAFATHFGFPARNTLDRATASLPKLYYARMDEMGLDFSVLYPTVGLHLPMLEDEEMRHAACRGLKRLPRGRVSGLRRPHDAGRDAGGWTAMLGGVPRR